MAQKQTNTPLKADHPEKPTITLGWSLEHPLGILTNHMFLLDVMVSRSGWHDNRGAFACSQLTIVLVRKPYTQPCLCDYNESQSYGSQNVEVQSALEIYFMNGFQTTLTQKQNIYTNITL